MAKMLEALGKWFGRRPGEGTVEEAEAADPILVLEEQLQQCRQEQDRLLVRLEALAAQAQQALTDRQVWLLSFDKITGQRQLDCPAARPLEKALCREGESLQEALVRSAEEKTVEVMLCGEGRELEVQRHDGEETILYTLLDVTEKNCLLARQQEARQKDPLTGLYVREALEARGKQLLEREEQVCGVHMQPLLREPLPGAGPMGTPEAFLRAWAEAVQKLPCPGLFTRTGTDSLQGILYGYDPEELPAILENLHRTLEKKTILLEPAGLGCYGVVLGTARYPGDNRSLEGLLLRARISAWLAGKQGREGICAYPGDNGVPEHLLFAREAFQELVQKMQVCFLIQPVVRTSNAKIEGYALFMESRSPRLTGMDQVREAADFLGRTQDLERLMWFQGMDRVKELVRSGKLLYNTKLWVPSLPGTYLPDEDAARFEELCFDHMRYLVLQLDGSREDLLCAGIKERRMACWDAATELRCAGLAQTGGLNLSLLQPKLIRADARLVEGIGLDPDKQKTFRALKAWCTAAGSRLLAEGIGNSADLRMAVQLGADLLQGDCLGRPDFGPADIPGNRIAQIGEAHYGKRG